MNILLVTPAFLNRGNNASGMPVAVYRIAKGLQLQGHNPIIVTGDNIEKYEKFDGIAVWRVDTQKPLPFANKSLDMVMRCFYGNYLLQKKVNAICKEQKIDIIQYSGNNGTGMFHYNKNIPAVMRVSSYFGTLFNDYTIYTRFEVVCHSFFERMAMKRMNGIYCPSKVLANDLSKILDRKINIIETPFFLDCELNYKIYNKRLKDKRYILFFGSISPKKGVFLIAEIIDKILGLYKDYYFVFVGKDFVVDGISTVKLIKQKIDSTYSERVIFIDSVGHSELYPIIQKSEMVLLPSFSENLSNACIESMGLGKIVIGTKEESFEQLIQNGVNGYLITSGSSQELYEAICGVIKLTDCQRKKMEELAQKRIERLKPEISIKKLIEYFTKIMIRKKYTIDKI